MRKREIVKSTAKQMDDMFYNRATSDRHTIALKVMSEAKSFETNFKEGNPCRH